jgi:hypothetical protein
MKPDFDRHERSFRFRVIAIFLITATFVAVDMYLVLSDGTHRGQIFGRDFMQYWSASHLIHEGRFDVLYNLEAFNAYLAEHFGPGLANHAFLYPPPGMFLVQPLRFLAYLPAYFSWCLITLLLYLIAVGFPDWSRSRLLLALLAPTTLLVIDAGQNGLLSGALFIAAMRLLDRRPVWSGILLGILSFKPHLGLLIPFALLAGRLWIPFAVASATVLILAVASLAVWGTDPWIAYIEQDAVAAALAFLERGAGFAMDMSLSPFMAARILGFGIGTGYTLQALCAVIAFASVVWSFRHGRNRNLQIATLATGTFLVSPYLFNYDMAMLMGAMIFLFEDLKPGRLQPRDRIILLCAWAAPSLAMLGNQWGLPLGPPALLALLFFLLARQDLFGWTRRRLSSDV